jgi:O-antigen/teichoic acid export membrane protein
MNISLLRSRFQSLAKEGIWVVTGQVATVLGGLVLIRVLTEYLKPEQYGQLALGLTVAAFFNQILFGSLSNGIVRFYSIAIERNELSRYLKASGRMMGYATALIIIIAFVIMLGLLGAGYGYLIGVTSSILVFSVLSSYNALLSGIQNAARQRPVAALHAGFDAWLKILLAVSVIHWLGSSSTAVVLGYALSSLIVTCSQLYFLRNLIITKTMTTRGQENWGRHVWLYSWPFATWGVFVWIQQVSDRWALETFVTTQELGMYAVLFQLGYSPIGLITSMAITFLAPILYQHSGTARDQARNRSVHRISWQITYIGLLVTALAFLLSYYQHEWIFKMLVATNYHAVSELLPWMVLSGGLFSASQILLLKLQSEMRHSKLIVTKIVTATIGIGLNFYGAWQFGIKGVVGALLAFSIITFLWMSWLAQHPPRLLDTKF